MLQVTMHIVRCSVGVVQKLREAIKRYSAIYFGELQSILNRISRL